MDATGRVIVVTGGAKGIGRALARGFAGAGAEAVIVADVDIDGATATAREIGGAAVRCDVSRESDVKELIDQVEVRHGRIDIFCSNAGIAVGGGPEAPNDEWQRIWDERRQVELATLRTVPTVTTAVPATGGGPGQTSTSGAGGIR